MSIYCSGASHVVWHYEGSHVPPWKSAKTQVEWDLSTIPPWIGRALDYDYDPARICPFARLSFVGPEDEYHAFIVTVPQANRLVEELTKFIDAPKVSVPRRDA